MRAFLAPYLVLWTSLGIAIVPPTPAAADGPAWPDGSFSGKIGLETTIFAEPPAFDRQNRNGASVAAEPRLLILAGHADIIVEPFVRLDCCDSRRTRADLREAKVRAPIADDWEMTAGFDTVAWIKTEGVDLVDIINQQDLVEGQDDEDKLGQPMVALRRFIFADDLSGSVNLFYLPYFRERTFPGPEGRLRSGTIVEEDADYLTDRGPWTPAFAARATAAAGSLDVGLSGFAGLSREPAFRPTVPGGPTVPVYDRILQAGLDGQYTEGAALWKLEAIYRDDQLGPWIAQARDFERQDYLAATGGIEYTLFGIADSAADLGLIGEYAWDQRRADAATGFQNDAIVGLRLTMNDVADTAGLLTASIDLETAETFLYAEFDRRLSSNYTIEVKAGAFLGTDRDSLRFDLRNDSYIRTTLSYFW